MKILYSIIFLLFTKIIFAQDTLKNNFPTYFISTIELRYELLKIKKNEIIPDHFSYYPSFKLDQSIKPFSPNEMPPYFDLELSEEDIFDFQSGFEIEPMEDFWLAEKGINYLTLENHYPSSNWVFSTNYDENESVNFYLPFKNKKGFVAQNQNFLSSIIYQKEVFLRSIFEINLRKNHKLLRLNLSYFNNLFYQNEFNTPVGFGDRAHSFFPEKYHELYKTELIPFSEIQNQNNSGINFYGKLFWSPIKKTFLKIESDFHQFYLSKNNQVRRNFSTLGIGVTPFNETFLFLEITNRTVGVGNFSNFILPKEDPYLAIYTKRILKMRLFKR